MASISTQAAEPGSGRLSALLWGALGVALFVAIWWLTAIRLGSFAVPTPPETFAAAFRLFAGGQAVPAILDTAGRVMLGFLLALGIGGGLGVVAGLLPPIRHMIGPLATMLLAVPPIAWIVLAVLWFGPSTPAVLFTVVVSLSTVPYLAALNGVATVDPRLLEMTRAFRLGVWHRIRVLYGPHLLTHLSPAAVAAFGLAWRLTLLAEVIAATSGIGSGLATARHTLDTAESFAWIGIVVLLFLGVRFGLLGPLERRLLPWKHAGLRSDIAHG